MGHHNTTLLLWRHAEITLLGHSNIISCPYNQHSSANVTLAFFLFFFPNSGNGAFVTYEFCSSPCNMLGKIDSIYSVVQCHMHQNPQQKTKLSSILNHYINNSTWNSHRSQLLNLKILHLSWALFGCSVNLSSVHMFSTAQMFCMNIISFTTK